MKLADLVPRFSVGRPVTVVTLFCVVMVVGVIATLRIPVQMMPGGWSPPHLWLWIPYEDSTPLETESRIVKPLEEQLSTVAGIKHIESESKNDNAALSIEFSADTDMDEAYNAVGDRIERAMPDLPDDVERVWVWRFDPTDEPVTWAGIQSPLEVGPEEQFFNSERIIKPRLERLDGVARVDVWGVPEPVVWIDFDRERLMSHQVDLVDLLGRLQGDNIQVGTGRVEDRGEVRYVRALARFATLDELREWPLGNGLVLQDIAEIRYAPAASTDINRIEGQEAAALGINKESGANTVQVCDDIRAAMKELEADPRLQGYKFHSFFDQGTLIEESMGALQESALEGGILAVLVLILFLREWRITALIAATIPASLLLTLTVMYFRGDSLNLLSMLGLMIAVGMVVDNAVVVVEAIYRRRQLGELPVPAAIHGTSEVLLPIVLSTLTSIVVFLPVILMSADADFSFFMSALGLPVVFIQVGSLLITLLFTPLSTVWLGSAEVKGDTRWMTRLSDGTVRILGAMLRRPVDTFVGMLAVVVLTLVLPARAVGCSDESEGNLDDFTVRFEIPRNFTYYERLRTVEAFEKMVAENREHWAVRTYRSRLGGNSTGGRLFAYLEDHPEGMSRQEILDDVKAKLPDLPGVKATIGWGEGESGRGNRIEVTLQGEDSEQITALSHEALRRLRSLEGVLSAYNDTEEEGNEEIRLRVDREAAARYNVSASMIGRVVAFAMRGVPLTPWVLGEREVRMFARFGQDDREDVERLLDFQVGSPTAGAVKLRALVDPEPGSGWGRIDRRDRKTSLGLTLDLADGVDKMAMHDRAMGALRGMDWPLGYGPAEGDFFEEQRESDSARNLALLLSLTFVFLIMGVLFESFLLPITVITTVPMAVFGVYWGLWITDTPFDSMGGVGMVILIGIVVNNGIVLIDRITELRGEGLARDEALKEAVRQRLRPILMTALTAIVGVIPMATGDDTFVGIPYAPLGRVVGFGMATATVLTLFFVPYLYAFLDDLRASSARWLAFGWPRRGPETT
ncbi:MAG: efflux RND transporter permease subunit [Deltaproteobacteria bacterium]|nr:efflux RND transporter permease subunit [Deltaproteobacteria bacterium]